MHEARDSELTPSSSTLKPVLAAVGALVGLMLLVCGGAAGYVALTSPPRTDGPASAETTVLSPEMTKEFQNQKRRMQQSKEVRFTADPTVIRKITAAIVDIDLPADFEPIEAQRNMTQRRVVFGKKSEDAALLKLAAFTPPPDDVAARAVSGDAFGGYTAQIVEMAENENGRNFTTLKKSREKIESAQRELTVLGQKAIFEFRHGIRDSDKKPVWKVWGAFHTATGAAALVYLVPESEYDEEAVVGMIESIRPAADDDSDTDLEAGPLQPMPEESIPGQPIPGNSTR